MHIIRERAISTRCSCLSQNGVPFSRRALIHRRVGITFSHKERSSVAVLHYGARPPRLAHNAAFISFVQLRAARFR